MSKKLQVFISSTYTDLIEERQVAVQSILDAGHIPAGMELFKAGKSQMKTIYKWIDESDVYMLILGGRYGSIEEESGLSYTELEYQYALSKNMPVFAIILDDNFLFIKATSKGKNTIFENDNLNKYNDFKTNVKCNIVKFVNNIDQISTQIHSQLNDILNDSDYNLVGWVRANDKIMHTSNQINTYKNNLIEELIYHLKNLTLSLDNLLLNLYIQPDENMFAGDWGNFATYYKKLYIFSNINKNIVRYYNNELQLIFSVWDELVSIIKNIKNTQTGIPNNNDNNTLKALFDTMHDTLSTLIIKCESNDANI